MAKATLIGKNQKGNKAKVVFRDMPDGNVLMTAHSKGYKSIKIKIVYTDGALSEAKKDMEMLNCAGIPGWRMRTE